MQRSRFRGLTLVAAMLALSMVPVGARADFHAACAPPPATSATVSLAVNATNTKFTFTGKVTCNGADFLKINSLTLRPVAPGTAYSAVPVTCTAACVSVTTKRTVNASPGVYDVFMSFTAKKGTLTFNRTRTGRWLWPGTGAPTKL